MGHLWAHRDDLFTFLHQPGLDATNWRAELAIRVGVILRKVWGGSRTWPGARAQSALMSVWRTCWQQGRSALSFLSPTRIAREWLRKAYRPSSQTRGLRPGAGTDGSPYAEVRQRGWAFLGRAADHGVSCWWHSSHRPPRGGPTRRAEP